MERGQECARTPATPAERYWDTLSSVTKSYYDILLRVHGLNDISQLHETDCFQKPPRLVRPLEQWAAVSIGPEWHFHSGDDFSPQTARFRSRTTIWPINGRTLSPDLSGHPRALSFGTHYIEYNVSGGQLVGIDHQIFTTAGNLSSRPRIIEHTYAPQPLDQVTAEQLLLTTWRLEASLQRLCEQPADLTVQQLQTLGAASAPQRYGHS